MRGTPTHTIATYMGELHVEVEYGEDIYAEILRLETEGRFTIRSDECSIHHIVWARQFDDETGTFVDEEAVICVEEEYEDHPNCAYEVEVAK